MAISMSTSASATGQASIRYVALGDSYTIGTGAAPEKAWPSVIAKRLYKKNPRFQLVGNLARAGWTSKDLIDYQLPVLETLTPDFVTVMIGTNDWVQEVDVKSFRGYIQRIFDRLLKMLPNAAILVITNPDFSVSAEGKSYSNGRNIAQGLAEFNQIIKDEAALRSVRVVDLFPLSQTMGQDSLLFSSDGLHPSAKGYALWADLIEPHFPN